MAKRKAHVADTAGIDIMGFDGEIAAMIKKPVEYVNGLARVGVHSDDMKSAIMVGGEPIEFCAGVGAVARIEVADCLAVAAGLEILTVSSRCGSITPHRRKRQVSLGVDENCVRGLCSLLHGRANRGLTPTAAS